MDSAEENGFTILFTSLTLILLAFFIFVNSSAVPNDLKERNTLKSIRAAFPGGSGTQNTSVSSKQSVTDPSLEALSRLPQTSSSPLFSSLRRIAAGSKVKVSASDRDIRLTFQNSSLFRSGGGEIRAENLPLLGQISEQLKTVTGPITIASSAPSDYRDVLAKTNPWINGAEQAMSLYRLFLDSGLEAKRLSASANLIADQGIAQDPNGTTVLAIAMEQ